MEGEFTDRKEHVHSQRYTYRFQHESLAPIPISKGGSGRPRFSVEPMVYFNDYGLDVVDPMTFGNSMLIAFRNYVRSMELMGMEHTGLSSKEITKVLENIWNKKENEWK
ncbi:MAG: hypothetical protein GWN01_01480 [Nitrosopumilaceae archaeon]|nr:hypothetical protein [Nitrosopumilaceae archaeon]NIU86030.1 hypothetical protein [Nitrosopumilaceae archaeon]NIX60249.1 hypothetical protein [Nitrosopumilaceae archaeon]